MLSSESVKNGNTLPVYEVWVEVLVTLTSGPRTRIILVTSGVRLATSTGLTVTMTALAMVEEVMVDGATVFEALRLKSSARCATVPLVTTSGDPDGSFRVTVI